MQNTPNPFNPSTLISFEIPTGYRGKASLNIYDLLGRNVKTLLDEEVDGGRFSVQWRGDNNTGTIVASGVYIYRLETENSISSRSMTLIR
jgi:flagellar hook assembly protein FlgD